MVEGNRGDVIAERMRETGGPGSSGAAWLTDVATGVLADFSHPHDPAGIRAAVTRRLCRP